MMPYVITAYNTLLPIFAAALYLLNICLDLIVNLEVIWWCPVFAAHALYLPAHALYLLFSCVFSLFFVDSLRWKEMDSCQTFYSMQMMLMLLVWKNSTLRTHKTLRVLLWLNQVADL